ETYQPSLAMGEAAVTPTFDYYLDADVQPKTDWARIGEVVREQVPDATVLPVMGANPQGPGNEYVDLTFLRPGATSDDDWISPVSSGYALGADVLVSDGSGLPASIVTEVPGVDLSTALAGGRAVVFTSDEASTALDQVDVRRQLFDD